MFEVSYTAARAAFRQEALAIGAELTSIPLDAQGERAADGSALTIDVAAWGRGDRTIVLSSGLHGVEGYVGSATQRLMMVTPEQADCRYVMIHALNPWGMEHFRRVNERNVDLNRNFLPSDEAYSGSPEQYARLNPLLNPARSFTALEFALRSGWQILRYGFEPLKQAIAGGQYDFPQGLFWGGAELEEGPHKLMERVLELVGAEGDIVWVDLHSGLGAFGELTYLLEASSGSRLTQRLNEKLGGRVQAWDEEGGVAYAIRGGFPAALDRVFGDRLTMLTCEFGTCSAVTVLRMMVLENQIVQHGGDRSSARQAMRRAFYPSERAWQDKALASAAELVGLVGSL